MSLIGCKVKHKAFGSGTIINEDNSHVEVEFANKVAKFVYPDAFKKFLVAEDETIQNDIQKQIDEKLLVEEACKAEIVRIQLEKQEIAKQAVGQKKSKGDSIRTKEYKRPEGKNATYFVFQGKTFVKEYEGRYLWAPIANKAGFVPHHWERLVEVQKGDIILHGCDGYIKAISIAKGKCYECDQPAELATEDAWDLKGRKLECEYTILENPVKTALFKNDIIRLSTAKYSPFDKDGNGNMGYLFYINRELAHIFIREAVERNQDLLNRDYIHSFIEENKMA